jgi:hypothetical protein
LLISIATFTSAAAAHAPRVRYHRHLPPLEPQAPSAMFALRPSPRLLQCLTSVSRCVVCGAWKCDLLPASVHNYCLMLPSDLQVERSIPANGDHFDTEWAANVSVHHTFLTLLFRLVFLLWLNGVRPLLLCSLISSFIYIG